MKLTYNGTTYTLTTAQLNGLRYAAANPSGAFHMERANDSTDEKLAAMGLLEKDYAYRDPQERKRMRAAIAVALQDALDSLRTNLMEPQEGDTDLSWLPRGGAGIERRISDQLDTKARQLAGSAHLDLGHLERTRYYLTEAAYGIVLQQFPMGVVFVPKQFGHLVPDTQAYYNQEAK
jgi:hypothetical protein